MTNNRSDVERMVRRETKTTKAKGMSITLRDEIETAINRNCAENGSDTPDFILAEYLTDCLAAYDKAVSRRTKWYGGNTVDDVLSGALTPDFSS